MIIIIIKAFLYVKLHKILGNFILNEIFLFSLKFHENINIPAAEVGASNSSSISLLPTPNEKL